MKTSPNRMLATIFGAVYLLVGIIGFTITGGVDFASNDGALLLGLFMVNPLHNIAHLLIGAALLIAGVSNVRAAKTVNIVVGAAYLLLGIVGFFVSGPFNVLALNMPDHFLHLGSAAVLIGIGLGTDKKLSPAIATA